MYSYYPERICPRRIDVELEADNETVKSVYFKGGCDGNTQAVAKLVSGMKVADVAALLEGTDCNGRGTSCVDQMVHALRKAQAELA